MVRPKTYGSSASTSAERQSLLRSKEDRKRVDGYLSQEAFGVLREYADTKGMNLSTALESIIWETQSAKSQNLSCAANQAVSANAMSTPHASLNGFVASAAVASVAPSIQDKPDVSSFFERRKREILKGE